MRVLISMPGMPSQVSRAGLYLQQVKMLFILKSSCNVKLPSLDIVAREARHFIKSLKVLE